MNRQTYCNEVHSILTVWTLPCGRRKRCITRVVVFCTHGAGPRGRGVTTPKQGQAPPLLVPRKLFLLQSVGYTLPLRGLIFFNRLHHPPYSLHAVLCPEGMGLKCATSSPKNRDIRHQCMNVRKCLNQLTRKKWPARHRCSQGALSPTAGQKT